jgi:hypothetical protein
MGSLKLKVLIGIGCAIVLVLVALLVRSGGRYRAKDASAESEPVQRSLEIIRALAQDPASASACMVAGANRQAQASVEEAARRVSGATAIELKQAAWFGDYLRVEVTCTRADGGAVEQYFLFREEGGKLRATGAGT